MPSGGGFLEQFLCYRDPYGTGADFLPPGTFVARAVGGDAEDGMELRR